ncbi:serine hydrolase [Pseudonocardia bannensis]|uniref:serine hydrolase n=1 Tax=Pseudonocardia bannensis TaxID=630973 RepID=UPI001FE90B64|nr:serine hydrolase domain-containing protein [Pseudonocardia bannensis]
MYETAFSVLIARASGQPLETFLRERIFDPLGMADTGFSVPAAKLDRPSTCCPTGAGTGALEVYDGPDDGRPSVELVTTDHITPGQTAVSKFFPGFRDSTGWGFGVSVVTRRDTLASVSGRFRWDGGLGTSWYSDPTEDLVGILMTQRLVTEESGRMYEDFWTSVCPAIDD